MEYKYRSEYFSGEGKRLIKSVVAFETIELCNTDVWDYCLSHYQLSTETAAYAQSIVDSDSEGVCLSYDFVDKAISLLIGDLTALFGWEPKYCIWLADYDSVVRQYGIPTTKCQVSDVILSDLGDDGVLYAYPSEPAEIEIAGTEFDDVPSEA